MFRRFGFTFVLAVLACGSPPTQVPPVVWHRAIGMIDGGPAAGPLAVPDSARVGAPIAAVASTYGSSCIHPGGAELQLAGLTADITPYDSFPSGPPCLPDWVTFSRSVGLVFDSPGTAVVRLHGRNSTGMPVQVEKLIVVVE